MNAIASKARADAAMKAAAAAIGQVSTYPSSSVANRALFLLILAGITSSLDRFLIAILSQPIKAELVLSDLQISLLQGFAFAALYAVAGLPFGRLVDRTNRRNILIVGVACWTCAAIACGFARTFQALFVSRLGVGIAEACLAPVVYSLVASYYRPAQHGRALAAFTAATAFGSGLSFVLGSAVFDQFTRMAPVRIPPFEHLSAWRLTFVTLAAPGFLVVLLLSTISEPPREISSSSGVALPSTGLGLPQYLRRHGRALAVVIAASSLFTMLTAGATMWVASVFQRTFHTSVAWTGTSIGLIMMLGPPVAGFIGGRFADSAWIRTRRGQKIWVLLFACVGALPLAIGWPLMPTAGLSMVMYGAWLTVSMAGGCVAPAILLDIVPSDLKGQVSAVYWLIVCLLGYGLGPSVTALLTDYVFKKEAMIAYSILTSNVIYTLLIVSVILFGRNTYDAAVRAVGAT